MNTKTKVVLGIAAGFLVIGVGANVAHWATSPVAATDTAGTAETHVPLSPPASPMPSDFGDRVAWAEDEGNVTAPTGMPAPDMSSPVPTDPSQVSR